MAAYAQLADGRLRVSGLVGSARSGQLVRAGAVGRGDAPETLGADVAEKLLAQGAAALLATSAEPDTGPYVS